MSRYVCTLLLVSLLGGGQAVADPVVPGPVGDQEPLARLDFAHLREAIESRSLRSIEAVLAVLPPAYRSHYVLMFDSRSLHASSFRDPRVILYGSDASLVLTFNGDPTQRGYATLETMEYEAFAGRFVFREVRFPAPGAAAGAVEFSADNPERCRACHGAPARPVWDAFPTWPGAYGERYLQRLSTREARGLEEFLANQPTHPRYRLLLDSGRFAIPDTFAPSASTRYGGVAAEPPNAELSTLLGRLNFAALAAELGRAPGFAVWRFALLAALEPGCGGIDEVVPPAAVARFSEPFAAFVHRTAEADARQLERKRLRLLTRDGSPPRAADVVSLDAFRYAATQGLGFGTEAWTLALEKGSFDLAMPVDARAELERQLLAQLRGTDPSLAEIAAERRVSSGERYCRALRRMSAVAFAGRAAAAGHGGPAGATRGTAVRGAGSGMHDASATLETCAACHLIGVGPDLPFDDPQRLAAELPRGGYPHGSLLEEIRFRLSPEAGPRRMPVGFNLSDAEGEALAAYLDALAR